MSEENVRPAKNPAYPKTALFGLALAGPFVVWCGKQIFTGAQNALDGKSNDPVIEDED